MNKPKYIILILLLCFFLTFAVYSLRTFADVGMTQEESPSYPKLIDIEPVDGTVNLEAESGEITVTNEFNAIKTAGGTIPNVKSGNLVVENGNPVSGKLVFSADSSFDLDDEHITVPKDGSIEFKDGKIIVSKGTSVEVDKVEEVDGTITAGTKLTAMTDGTEIKIEENLIEVIKGYVSIDYSSDYETSPVKIILSGKDSVLELRTEEKEKFEFKNSDGKELIVNIGSFHDSKSEEFKGKNCISYKDMGLGINKIDEWDKIKIDGNAIITKYFNEEKIYEIKFEDGKASLSRDLSKLVSTEFNQKTVINYNSGDITLFIETSEKRAEEINIGRINVGNGIIDAEFYNDINVQIANEPPLVKPPEIPKTTETQGTEGGTETSGTSGTVKTETDATKKAEGIMINSNGELYLPSDEIPINEGDKSIAETVRNILNNLNYNTMTEGDIFAAMQQETSFNPRPGDGGKSVGLMQSSVPCFKDAIQLWKKLGMSGNEKYQKLYETYTSYSDEQLKNALDDVNINLEVGISYFKLMEDNYGFSEQNLENKYGYTGDEKDILLLGYNGGPGAMKQVLIYTEENIGKDEWDFDDLEEFLWDEDKVWYTIEGEKIIGGASKEAEDVLGMYYDDVDTKTWIMINHVKRIKTYAGYSGYEYDEKPDWVK